MKKVFFTLMIVCLAATVGCSCISQVEREQFRDPKAREEYASIHPESRYAQNICAGEITRGMSGHEVMASWGLPNVYLISKNKPEEYWVYYVENIKGGTILIYTLTFDDMNNLCDWDIGMKRIIDHSYVSNPNRLKDKITVKETDKR